MTTTDQSTTHLISQSGERGPRVDVVVAMFARMLEYEEEVARGDRTPNYILDDNRRAVAKDQLITKQRRSRLEKKK